ncbi:MAG: hypothetical protein IJ729_07115, partial [Alloprevotella sp.]|nr:hypothetical protein [Alloprevotella sp.]
DSNALHMAAAEQFGLPHPIADRDEAARDVGELVEIRDSEFTTIDRLSHSIPYLTPHAADLLERIGRNFRDSLLNRGIRPYKVIVTSVLRTEEDVARLRRVNRNASGNSAHRYGTTFDISTLRYNTPTSDSIPRQECHDTPRLRQVLEYVLRDLRHEGWCYVVKERRQHCYHITARY